MVAQSACLNSVGANQGKVEPHVPRRRRAAPLRCAGRRRGGADGLNLIEDAALWKVLLNRPAIEKEREREGERWRGEGKEKGEKIGR